MYRSATENSELAEEMVDENRPLRSLGWQVSDPIYYLFIFAPLLLLSTHKQTHGSQSPDVSVLVLFYLPWCVIGTKLFHIERHMRYVLNAIEG